MHNTSDSGVVQWLACWAHNPKVRGSKPRSAKFAKPGCRRPSERWPKGMFAGWQDVTTSEHSLRGAETQALDPLGQFEHKGKTEM